MKTITKNYELYGYDELDKEAQKKAREQFADINVDYYWDQVEIWNAQDMLEELGYRGLEISDKPRILYSGFGSQGDGACFEARVDVKRWIEAHNKKTEYRALYTSDIDYKLTVKHGSSHYYHEHTMDVDYEIYGDATDKQREQLEKIAEYIQNQECPELGKKIYGMLEDEYFSRLSDEAVEEALIAGEYLFLKSGKPFTEEG